jgi:hypothetical protein
VSARDPRRDPRPGDVLRTTSDANPLTIHVRDVDYGTLEVVYQIEGVGELLRHDLDDWQQDAATDTVVRRAEDAAVQS